MKTNNLGLSTLNYLFKLMTNLEELEVKNLTISLSKVPIHMYVDQYSRANLNDHNFNDGLRAQANVSLLHIECVRL